MRLLDRYLLRELLVPLAFCLGGFLVFWISSDVLNNLQELHEKKLHALDIGAYYLVQLPEILVLLMPVALLLALLYALTNHARNNELTAIRAAGVSLWRLCAPYFGVGLLISLASLALNEYWVPGSVDAAKRIKERYTSSTPPFEVRDHSFFNDRDRRVWEISRYDSRTGEMHNPIVDWAQPDGAHLTLSAERAERTNDAWTFYQLRVYRAREGAPAVPVLVTNELAFPEFTETVEQINSGIKIGDSIALLTTRTKKADLSIAEIRAYQRLHPHPPPFERVWLATKLQGRLATPWTCLVVIVIAVPFGAVSGRRNVFVGVASSIVICFAFFVLQQTCLALGTGGYLAPWLAGWLPNLAFATAGAGLMFRAR